MKPLSKVFFASAALAVATLVSGTSSAQQVFPQGFDPGPSALPSEQQLMAAGCVLNRRDFQKGTLYYECPPHALDYIGNPGANAGPRCSLVRAFANGILGFQCRENLPSYDQDYPQWRRDFGPRPHLFRNDVPGSEPRRRPHNGGWYRDENGERRPGLIIE